MRLLAAVLLLGGCVHEHEGTGVTGSSADVTTPPGDYTGYRVVMPCEGNWTDVGVIGTGAIAVTQTADVAAAGQELRAQLLDIESIHGWGGYGLACEPGIGTSIWLDDWRDVDPLIERIGAWLRERDYALQVGIDVSSIPVPHTSD